MLVANNLSIELVMGFFFCNKWGSTVHVQYMNTEY